MNLQRPAGEEEMGPCKRPSKTVYRVFGAQMYDDGRSLMEHERGSTKLGESAPHKEFRRLKAAEDFSIKAFFTGFRVRQADVATAVRATLFCVDIADESHSR